MNIKFDINANDLLEEVIGSYESAVIIIPDGDGFKALTSMSENEAGKVMTDFLVSPSK